MRYVIPDRFPTTRQIGDRFRRELEDALRSARPGSTVEISFDNVEAMTMSFTDEFLGRLLTARSAGDIPNVALILTGLTDETSHEIDVCLERRGAAAAWEHEDRGVDLLGGEEHLKETFREAARRGEFSASELATSLNLSPQNINNRLRKLVDGGALIRARRDPERGGREFLYRVPSSACIGNRS